MADRIVVLSANPGRIRTVIENRLPRPRDMRSPEFLRLVDEIHDVITSAELPDVVVSAPTAALAEDVIEPLPQVRSGDVLALIDHLDAQGGTAEIFQVAAQTHTPFDLIVRAVKAAEMLDLVDTPKRLVVLTPLGRRFAAAAVDERKRTWAEQTMTLRLFRVAHDLIEQHGGELSREELMREIGVRLPMEDPDLTFDTLVGWGRFGGLLTYDDDRNVLSLP
jgi:NitT/TauT family transport system ATP-binding protein